MNRSQRFLNVGLGAILGVLLCTTALSQSFTIASIPLQTGKQYGITAWYGSGAQKFNDSSVYGYGVNLKYTPIGFVPYDTSVKIDVLYSYKERLFARKRKQTRVTVDTITDRSAHDRYVASGSTSSYDTVESGGERIVTVQRIEVVRSTDTLFRTTRVATTHEPMLATNLIGECALDSTIKCTAVVKYRLRASLGLGYLAYYGLTLPTESISGNFDVAAPYAGLYVTADLLLGVPVSLVLAYTSSFPSGDIVANYVGPTIEIPNGQDMTNFPVSYKVATTPTHEFGIGASFSTERWSFFVEWFYHQFRVRNIQFQPITGVSGFPRDQLQENLGSDFDLSFRGFKGGVSLNF